MCGRLEFSFSGVRKMDGGDWHSFVSTVGQVKIFGVPLHPWREGVFRLLGDCLEQTLEVD